MIDNQTIVGLVGGRRKVHLFKKKRTIFSQGDAAESVFYLQEGRIQLSILSRARKGSDRRGSR